MGQGEKVFTEEEMEAAVNQTYPGLTMFVRDVDLPAHIAEKLILREAALCDVSPRVGGMATTHRFAILSNHMTDLSLFEHGTHWGLCVAQANSRFKVIGKYTHNGKTMIMLLHLPNDDAWKVFQNVAIKKKVLASLERQRGAEPDDL
jgi:hypothetical protein